jgi:CheY-like chemotaxis protein
MARVASGTILVAEDNGDDALLLKRAFSKAAPDLPLCFVRDGQEAIDFLAGGPLQGNPSFRPPATLVLLDLKMPRCDGFDVLAWLQSRPELRDIPVIVFSSSDEPRDMDRAHALGAKVYLVKPTDLNEYLNVVRQLKHFWVINCPSLPTPDSSSRV